MSLRPTAVGLRRSSAVALAGASLFLAAGLASVFLRTSVEAWGATAASGPASLADGILLLTGIVGMLLTLWLGLGTALSALAALPGVLGHACRELAARVAPAAVRKGVAVVLGTTLTAAFIPGTAVTERSHEARPGVVATGSAGSRQVARGLTVAAPDASFRLVAEPDPRSETPDGAVVTDAAPSPTWSPDGTGGTAVNRQSGALNGHQVVVLRGDTLWDIAARQLGPEAGPAAIDAQWRLWFALNGEVIGEDADRILPGQPLTPPVSAQASRSKQSPGSRSSNLGAGS